MSTFSRLNVLYSQTWTAGDGTTMPVSAAALATDCAAPAMEFAFSPVDTVDGLALYHWLVPLVLHRAACSPCRRIRIRRSSPVFRSQS
jgi:hypothetical protein